MRAGLVGISMMAAALGCSNKEEETDGGGQEETTPGDPSGDPSGDPTDEPTGGAGSHRVCDLYLNCLAVIAPTELPAAQQGFGPDGTCWQGSQASADQCLMACKTGLTEWHEVYPDEPACGLCQADADCTGDNLCYDGECGPPRPAKCGNETLDADEVCDNPDCDEDCLGPAVCNPLNQAGCAVGEVCLHRSPEMLLCEPKAADMAQLGEPCDAENICVAGSLCMFPFFVPNCTGEGCCASFCDLANGGDCQFECVSAEGFLDKSLRAHVGVCIAP